MPKAAPLDSVLKRLASNSKSKEPVWKGLAIDGITYSLLSRFIQCRERFRILVIEGLKTADNFNHRIEYGNLWHTCEEALAGRTKESGQGVAGRSCWDLPLASYSQSLLQKYPMQREQISHWYEVCQTQFPIYVDYWSKHRDVVERNPLFQEQVFDVPYKVPSGRVVRLRGKFDSVDLIGNGSSAALYVQENKTKGDIDERAIKAQMQMDLQTQMYLVALGWVNEHDGEGKGLPKGEYRFGAPIGGVRYNVVRRPLSGGKGTITRWKGKPAKKLKSGKMSVAVPEETKEHYYDRLRGIIDGSAEDSPGPEYFFMRWKAEVSQQDTDRFRRECLDPILEQLCDWWEWMKSYKKQYDSPFSPDVANGCSYHWRHPFGVRNILDEGGSSDLDGYLETGSTLGLKRVDTLFPELVT